MTPQLEQLLTVERGAYAERSISDVPLRRDGQLDERAARRALRAQVAKLERELSEIVANGFPHIAPPGQAGTSGVCHRIGGAPRLLNLEQLERTRDELAGRVQLAHRATAERVELETRSRELLERMKREPAHYKFVRLPVRDLGEHGCGVWEVRPRMGLLGMLAGWWEVKLSSGCPLPWGSRGRATPPRFNRQGPPLIRPRSARDQSPAINQSDRWL